MLIATAKQIGLIDRYAIKGMGIPSTLLMENAAAALCAAVFSDSPLSVKGQIYIFCGRGNNGGDGLAAARILHMRGLPVTVISVGDSGRVTEDRAEMEARLQAVGIIPIPFVEFRGQPESGDIIIDAIFGVGFRGELSGETLAAVRFINASGAYVISADIPSGLEADSAKPSGEAIRADLTVTFTLPKLCHFFHPASSLCGRVMVADIGIPDEAVASQKITAETTSTEMCEKILPMRDRWAHKGNFGKISLLCGSVGYAGAANFASRAAVVSGAGLVSLYVPASIYTIAAVKSDETMVFSCPDEDGRLADVPDDYMEKITAADALLIGPGLGRGERIESVVFDILNRARAPVILDADGINAIAGNINILRTSPTIITPHDGEFARLRGGKPPDDRAEDALSFAAQNNCVVVLKGHRTLIAAPDGHLRINITGGPGMAKGGSGDVLAGIITAFAGMGLTPFDAASAGVYIHGRAGDMCARDIGEYGMTPTDIIRYIPKVLKPYDPKETDNFWE